MEKRIEIPVENYTRTCGYFASRKNVNRGKLEEIKERAYINIEAFKKGGEYETVSV